MNLTIGTSAIRELDGLFSLNDLHKASGGEEKNRPNQFLRSDQTKALVVEISNAQIRAIETRRGAHGGTYACRELVIAYAAWISAAFHLKVIRVFLGYVQQAKAEPQARSLLNRRWLISYDYDGSEKLQEVSWDECVLRYRDLPKLLGDPGNPIAPELLAQIGAACIERLSHRVSALSLHKPG